MSAVILPFPCGRRDRAPVNAQTASPEEAIISRARQIAWAYSLNNFDRATVVRAAQHWLQCGIRDEDVLKRADAMAKRLATSHGPDGPVAA